MRNGKARSTRTSLNEESPFLQVQIDIKHIHKTKDQNVKTSKARTEPSGIPTLGCVGVEENAALLANRRKLLNRLNHPGMID